MNWSGFEQRLFIVAYYFCVLNLDHKEYAHCNRRSGTGPFCSLAFEGWTVCLTFALFWYHSFGHLRNVCFLFCLSGFISVSAMWNLFQIQYADLVLFVLCRPSNPCLNLFKVSETFLSVVRMYVHPLKLLSAVWCNYRSRVVLTGHF